jgi:hypothetical protein
MGDRNKYCSRPQEELGRVPFCDAGRNTFAHETGHADEG